MPIFQFAASFATGLISRGLGGSARTGEIGNPQSASPHAEAARSRESDARALHGFVTNPLVSFGIEYGLLLLIGKIFGHRKKKRKPAAEVIDPPSTNEDEAKQKLPNQRIVIGTTTVYGQRDFRMRYDASYIGSSIHGSVKGDNKGSYLIEGFLLANHETTMRWMQLDGIDVTVRDANLFSYADQYRNVSGSFLALDYKSGTYTQKISPLMRRNFTKDQCPDTFRLLGHSYAVMERFFGVLINTQAQVDSDQETEGQDIGKANNNREHDLIWSSETNENIGSAELRIRMDGLKCWNPLDADQIREDPSTWKHSNNNAVVTVNLMCNMLFSRRPLSFDDFDMDTWKRSIRVCDLGVPTLRSIETGNTAFERKRYTVSGVISTEERPIEVLNDLRLAANADLLYFNAKWHYIVGEPQDPVASLTDDMIIGDESWRSALPSEEVVDALIVRCVVTPEDLITAEGDIPDGEGYIEADLPVVSDRPQHLRTTPNEDQLDIRFAEGSEFGQWLGWVHYNRAQLGKAFSTTVDIRAAGWYQGMVLSRYSLLYPHRNGIYQIESIAPSDDLQSYEISFVEYSKDIYNISVKDQIKPLDPRTLDD